jgi:hypothetical protein
MRNILDSGRVSSNAWRTQGFWGNSEIEYKDGATETEVSNAYAEERI